MRRIARTDSSPPIEPENVKTDKEKPQSTWAYKLMRQRHDEAVKRIATQNTANTDYNIKNKGKQ